MMKEAASLFAQQFIARVREARIARGWTQEQCAVALGVTPVSYRKYETRTVLPMYLLERFALAVNRDIHFIVTGRARRDRPPEA
jgi:transcriptional regulator with XRE-family HTH domain